MFATNSAQLTAAGRAAIDNVIAQLATFDKVDSVTVSGHADSRGNDAYNQSLSERRAASVRDYMAANGIDAGILSAVGMGESAPVATNDTAEGRAQNRRVEIDVSGFKIVN